MLHRVLVLLTICFQVTSFHLNFLSRFKKFEIKDSSHNFENSNYPKSLKNELSKDLRKTFQFILASTVIPRVTFAKGVGNSDESSFYLTDPTEDFKEDEARTKAFSAEQLKIKNKWDIIVKELENTSDQNTAELEAKLKNLIKFLQPLDGVPSGFKKRELVKICRIKKFENEKRRKIRPSWTKECEIAYQELIQLINAKLLPNNKV